MDLDFGNAQHAGARREQQDSFCFSNPADSAFIAHAGVLAVLADGMGGFVHGGEASRAAAAVFLAAYLRKTSAESIPGALLRSLHEANAAVFSITQQVAGEGEAGTTLVAAVFHNGGLHWISVGDTALLLVREGHIGQLNAIHTYASILDARVAAGEITAEQALAEPQREALISHVGRDRIPYIDRNDAPFSLHPGDVVFLASDGLFKTLAADEMLAQMHGSPQAQCDRLVEEALSRGLPHQDNVTVLAIRSAAPDAAAVTQPVEPSPPPPLPTQSSRRLLMLGAALACMLALAGAGYWSFGQSETAAIPSRQTPPQDRR